MSRYREWDLACKVYVGNLGSNTSKHDLENAFSKYGPLRNVWVARDPPGFAFVQFEDRRDAEDATRGLDGTHCCGTRIRVEMSTGRSRRYDRRRGGGGSGGGGSSSGGGRSRRYRIKSTSATTCTSTTSSSFSKNYNNNNNYHDYCSLSTTFTTISNYKSNLKSYNNNNSNNNKYINIFNSQHHHQSHYNNNFCNDKNIKFRNNHLHKPINKKIVQFAITTITATTTNTAILTTIIVFLLAIVVVVVVVKCKIRLLPKIQTTSTNVTPHSASVSAAGVASTANILTITTITTTTTLITINFTSFVNASDNVSTLVPPTRTRATAFGFLGRSTSAELQSSLASSLPPQSPVTTKNFTTPLLLPTSTSTTTTTKKLESAIASASTSITTRTGIDLFNANVSVPKSTGEKGFGTFQLEPP